MSDLVSGMQLRLPRIDVRPSTWHCYALALLALFGLHTLALEATFGQGLGWAAADAILPTAAIALLGPILRLLLLRSIFRLPLRARGAAHIAASLAFAVLLYWLTQVLIGVAIARDAMRFAAPDFFAPAAAWQLVQGIVIYAVIGLSSYVEVLHQRLRFAPASLAQTPGVRPEAEVPLRLFIKKDEEFRPIDPARIILARGADDYAEIETTSGVHLARMTLAALSEKLGAGFMRVHRSCLVNVDCIGKAEPAGGGRILLHMANGTRVTTSRAGARLLRERIV